MSNHRVFSGRRCLTLRGAHLGFLLAGAVTCLPALAENPWPMDTSQAQTLQQETARQLASATEKTLELAPGVTVTLVLLPAGQFTMGAPDGESPLDPDEGPQSQVRIAKPFWMARCEVTNQLYRLFDSAHDSRTIDTNWKDRVGPGISANADQQPVIRVSWYEAMGFCRWLSERTGLPFRLPTEPEWEWACRAGTASPWQCSADDLFRYANYADSSVASVKPWALRDAAHNDGERVSAVVGKYLPNAWGLCDLHGNVAEWCSSLYRPYPYTASAETPDPQITDASQAPVDPGARVVRGGSWDDRPVRVRSAARLGYQPDLRVYNVGFRVVCTALPGQ